MTTIAAPVETDRPDTPRSAYAVLERRATLITCLALLALAGIAWWRTAVRSEDMNGMVDGIARVGSSMSFDMTVGVFLGMWVLMMVAMMFPTIAPIVLLHRMVIRRRGGGITPTAVFVAGYLLVWTTIGVVPLVALLGFREVAETATWVPRLGGAVLVVAGAYQFTRWKQTCLKACRSPLTFLATHDFGRGLLGTLRAGVTHGAYCLGCCWALMSVLFVVGLMNLAWMAGIAVVFLAEKNWRHGVALTKVVGVSVIALGIAVLVHPDLLASVTSSAGGTEMDMEMEMAPMMLGR
jgi:predicted metal-binding membrane protein